MGNRSAFSLFLALIIWSGGDPGACQSPSPPTLPRGRRLKAGDRVIPYGGVEAFTWGCTSQITTTEGEKTGGMTKMLNWNPETGDDDTGRCQHDRLQSAPDSSGERPPSLGVWYYLPEGCELLVFDSYDDELEECTGNVLNWTPSTVAAAGSAAAKGGYNPSEALDDGCLMLCCPKNDLGGPGFVGPVKADDHLSNAVINSVLQGTQGSQHQTESGSDSDSSSGEPDPKKSKTGGDGSGSDQLDTSYQNQYNPGFFETIEATYASLNVFRHPFVGVTKESFGFAKRDLGTGWICEANEGVDNMKPSKQDCNSLLSQAKPTNPEDPWTESNAVSTCWAQVCDESLENCGNVRSMRHGDFYGLVEYIVIHNSGAGYLKSTQYTGGACRGTGDNYGLSVDVNKVPGTSVAPCTPGGAACSNQPECCAGYHCQSFSFGGSQCQA